MSDGDSLLDMLGLDSGPVTGTALLWTKLTEGQHQKIHTLRYWLKFEMCRMVHMLDNNIKITRSIVKDGQAINAPLSRLDFAKVAIDYYLDTYHLPWFTNDIDNRGVADKSEIIDKIVAHPDIKEVIDGEKNAN